MLREAGQPVVLRYGYYSRVRRVDLLDGGTTLARSLETPQGARLSRILEVAAASGLELDINAARVVRRSRRSRCSTRTRATSLTAPTASRAHRHHAQAGAGRDCRIRARGSRRAAWLQPRAAVEGAACSVEPRRAPHQPPHRCHAAGHGRAGARRRAAARRRRPAIRRRFRDVGDRVPSGGREPMSERRADGCPGRCSSTRAKSRSRRSSRSMPNGESGYIAAPVALETFLARYEGHAAAHHRVRGCRRRSGAGLGPRADRRASQTSRMRKPSPREPSSSELEMDRAREG